MKNKNEKTSRNFIKNDKRILVSNTDNKSTKRFSSGEEESESEGNERRAVSSVVLHNPNFSLTSRKENSGVIRRDADIRDVPLHHGIVCFRSEEAGCGMKDIGKKIKNQR